MGKITTDTLELMQISWEYFPVDESEVFSSLRRATDYMTKYKTPYAFIMRKGSVDKYSLKSNLMPKPGNSENCASFDFHPRIRRNDVLRSVQKHTQPRDVVLATTGFSGRELYACGDRENQLYMVGSMGCVSSLGLGMAIVQPSRCVIAIDGDGALLMRMGALATIGYERPRNLMHILIDNEIHESTGGQSTVSHSVSFCSIAAACGYTLIECITNIEELETILKKAQQELTFIHVKTLPGILPDLPRPNITPVEVANRLRDYMKKT